MMDKKNLMTRILSGAVIGLIFVTSIMLVRPLFYVVMLFVTIVMLLEWYSMTKGSLISTLFGEILIPLSIASLLIISYLDESGWLLLTFFSLIWMVDVNAMLGGKLVGGPKLAPTLSPNKTISGLVIGVLSATIIVNILSLIPSYQLPYSFLNSTFSLSVFCLIMGCIAQMSDLLVSFFKRRFNIKDTGSIIPGHGGVLDRFDSIILTAPITALYLMSHL
ncbi:phosphatidate cytidylyltransferase [Rickettsiaceae bacterium]|nr:phosphatidate cytidylyltransferase [Rickettsiaceae bacterium]